MAKKTNKTAEDIVVEPLESESIPANDDEIVVSAYREETVDADETYAIFQQGDGMLAWSIQNLRSEDGKLRSKRDLKNDPPILRIEASEGQSVDFILTKEFTKTLNESLGDVRQAFYGIEKKRKPLVSFKDAVVASIYDKPLAFLLVAGLGVLSLLFLVFG